ncbi:MAG TPA: FoF1 ATP synthase subunit gamma [Candidatus Babeliales bacterium]|nr:FoF1 ATP synthase subunit gamma [Candidatus Babeliales bacterium]
MAQLIQMRQRIKAIETIKKITHAMRLISMSNHSRLKGKEYPLTNYTNAINDLFYTIKAQTPEWKNPVLYPTTTVPKTLIVLVGSQKGLCGNFNTALFKQFESHMKLIKPKNLHFIAIGKKAVDYAKDHLAKKQGILIASYPDFSTISLFALAKTLTEEIMIAGKQYTDVLIASNKPKTFFVQKPYITQLIPFINTANTDKKIFQDYEWEQNPQAILDILARQCLEATIQNLLFQSLLSEQAARFLSMDSSTRNAESLLEITELHYNKLRQAKITKELTELTGSF